MINRERLAQTFKHLVEIDSPSGHEGTISDEVQKIFKSLGAETHVDDTGRKIDGDTGNLIVKFKGNRGAVPILFNAHMDTVEPGKNIQVVLNEGVFTSDGQTILGADDKSGIAILIEAMRVIHDTGMPFGPVEMVFTVSEEVGILGAKHFDVSLVDSKYGFAMDSGDTESIVTQSPEDVQFQIKIHGQDAHAGVAPEEGINAIQIASRAIAKIHTGRIDEDTTCNVGMIEGGIATNIVPNLVTVKGEVRSHHPTQVESIIQDIISTFYQAVESSKRSASDLLPRVETLIEKEFPLTSIPKAHPVIERVQQAAKNLGREMVLKKSGGGSDANIFFEKGIVLGVLGTGMKDMHTLRESIRLDDMAKTVELIVEIIKIQLAMKSNKQDQ